MEINLTVDNFLRESPNLIHHVFIDYPVFLSAAYFRVPVFRALCVHVMTLYQYFKSELPCRSQASEYLTVHDIESANGKGKPEIAKTRHHLKRNVKYT